MVLISPTGTATKASRSSVACSGAPRSQRESGPASGMQSAVAATLHTPKKPIQVEVSSLRSSCVRAWKKKRAYAESRQSCEEGAHCP
jgi:hypothetical protein